MGKPCGQSGLRCWAIVSIFRSAGATPKHVLHAATQAEHRFATQNADLNLYGACKDGVLGAGKLQVWKGVGVEVVAKSFDFIGLGK
jgi:hypothetical protein